MNGMEIRLVGLSRSGNHAVAEWILAQAPGRTCYLNCAEGKTNPFATCRPLGDGQPARASWPGFDLSAEAAGVLSRKDLLLHSYEDSFLAHALGDVFEDNHDAWVGPSRRRLDVVVLRDPFNLFASRRAAGSDLSPVVARRMWMQHARAHLSPLWTRKPRPPLVPVSYNRWATSRDYRRALAERLGLPFSDAGVERVADCHGGSSFDGLAYDGRASTMPVLDRWRAYADDARYRALFDDRLRDLSVTLFGAAPPLPGEAPLVQARAGAPSPSNRRSSAQSPATRSA